MRTDDPPRPPTPVHEPARLTVIFGPPTNGWIELTLRAGDMGVTERFSHIYPSLRDLCSATCDVLNGAPPRKVTFLLEPAELELSIVDATDATLALRGHIFRDRGRERDGAQVLEHKTTSRELVLTLWRALRRLETSLPEADFIREFREPFPKLEMASLSRLIDRETTR